MEKLKGIKVLRNKRGKPKQLVIDIDKHYDIVEDLVDVLEAESRLKEKGKPAEDVFREIEAGFNKKEIQEMIYKIVIQDSVQKELESLPQLEFKKIQKAILSLSSNPFPSGSLKLKGTKEKLYRVRKGDYRIIYTVDHAVITITILKIAHRRDVYKF